MNASPSIIVTSLAPGLRRMDRNGVDNGARYQRRCVSSWIEAGVEVLSVNSSAEARLLRPMYPDVSIVSPGSGRNEGPPSMSALLQAGLARSPSRPFALANSDIEVLASREVVADLFAQAGGGCVFVNRAERPALEAAPGPPYRQGVDVFFLDPRFVAPEDLEGFSVGQPWWDYLLLFSLAARRTPLAGLEAALFSHLTHDQAWRHDVWRAGLGIVADHLQVLAAQEGPVAALLAFLCRNVSPGALAGFGMDGVETQFGTALGAAMLDFAVGRCERSLSYAQVLEGDQLQWIAPARSVRMLRPETPALHRRRR